MKVTEYKEEFGEIRLPDGFADELRGKTVEEQIACYAVSDLYRCEMSYHMTSDMQHHAPVSKVGFDAAIINDGLVVGFMRGDKAYLPYHVVDSSYESDNSGAGYKESTTRYYLVVLWVHRARYVTFRRLVRLSIRSQSRSLRGTERSICRKSF